jgi:hypothetical protein
MRKSLLGIMVAVAGLGACGSEGPPAVLTDGTPVGETQTVYGQQQTLIPAAVGQELGVKLGTIGPGMFDSLPAISSTRLRFIDAAVVGPYEPGGPQQLFRFTAVASGRVIVAFRFSSGTEDSSRQVVDTIDVR